MAKSKSAKKSKKSKKEVAFVPEVEEEADQGSIHVATRRKASLTCFLLWVSALMMHKLPPDVRINNLLGPRPKTKADREEIKHHIYEEFRGTCYETLRDDGPTRLVLPSRMLKAAMFGASTYIKGVFKRDIGRKVWVMGDELPLWGMPYMDIRTAKNKGQYGGSQDERTRAFVYPWCSLVTIEYDVALFNRTKIAEILTEAGMSSGVGDGRPEKGKLSYGRFRIAEESEVREIMEKYGREAQDAALAAPQPHNKETADMVVAWHAEMAYRDMLQKEQSVVGTVAQTKGNGKAATRGKKGNGKAREAVADGIFA